jgi:hypothetical protein
MKRWIVAALLVLPAAAPAAPQTVTPAARDVTDPNAVAVIDACIARLDAQIDVGYERIARRCPDLAPALEQSGWAAWLPQGWKESRNDLSAGSLKELRAVVSRELATRPALQTPRVERLKEILADLGTTGQQRSGAWSRFKKWVRSLFERAGQQNRESWLSRLVSRAGVSDTVIELITYIALALVVALAGFIVFNELRLAGLLGRKRAEGAANGDPAAPGTHARLTWKDVERAAFIDQPRLLLELIATKLTDLGRLPPAGAFTAREIVRAADLDQAADRGRLQDVALTAERTRYAAESVPPAAVDAAVGSGRELLARLETSELDEPPANGADAPRGVGS